MSNTTHNQDQVLAALVNSWQEQKDREREAIAFRVAIEEQIAEIIDLPAEGTTRVQGLKITTKLSRKWDQEKLDAIADTVSAEFFPFKQEWKEILKDSRYAKEKFPDLWATISPALTLTPSKPSFSAPTKKEDK